MARWLYFQSISNMCSVHTAPSSQLGFGNEKVILSLSRCMPGLFFLMSLVSLTVDLSIYIFVFSLRICVLIPKFSADSSSSALSLYNQS